MTETMNLDKDILDNAKFSAAKVEDTYLRKRTYALNIAANAAAKFLNEKGLKISCSQSLYKSPAFSKEIELADIYSNGARFDVRVTFNEKTFCVPKSHSKFDIKPCAYIVAKFDSSLKNIEFLGFVPENELEYQKTTSEYYTFSNDILKPIEDFVEYTKNLKTSAHPYDEKEHEAVKEICLNFIDNRASEADKIYFIKHVIDCPVCRETFRDMNDFDDIVSQLKNYNELLNDSTLSVLSGNKQEVDQAAIANMSLVENAQEDSMEDVEENLPFDDEEVLPLEETESMQPEMTLDTIEESADEITAEAEEDTLEELPVNEAEENTLEEQPVDETEENTLEELPVDEAEEDSLEELPVNETEEDTLEELPVNEAAVDGLVLENTEESMSENADDSMSESLEELVSDSTEELHLDTLEEINAAQEDDLLILEELEELSDEPKNPEPDTKEETEYQTLEELSAEPEELVVSETENPSVFETEQKEQEDKEIDTLELEDLETLDSLEPLEEIAQINEISEPELNEPPVQKPVELKYDDEELQLHDEELQMNEDELQLHDEELQLSDDNALIEELPDVESETPELLEQDNTPSQNDSTLGSEEFEQAQAKPEDCEQISDIAEIEELAQMSNELIINNISENIGEIEPILEIEGTETIKENETSDEFTEPLKQPQETFAVQEDDSIDEVQPQAQEELHQEEPQQAPDVDEDLKELLDDDLLALLSDDDDSETAGSFEAQEDSTALDEQEMLNNPDSQDTNDENPDVENLYDGQEIPAGENVELDLSQEPVSEETIKKTKKLAVAGALIVLLAIGGGAGAWYMYHKNNVDKEAMDTSAGSEMFDFENQDSDTNTNETAAVPQDINKSMTNSFSDKPAAISITKLSWQISEKLAVEPSVKEYLQTAGKNIQMNLQNDLANASDIAFNNSVKVSFEIAPDNTMKGIQVLESSGSDKIDEAITKSIKNTLKYVSVPKLQNYKSDYFLTLIINF